MYSCGRVFCNFKIYFTSFDFDKLRINFFKNAKWFYEFSFNFFFFFFVFSILKFFKKFLLPNPILSTLGCLRKMPLVLYKDVL